MTEPRAFAVDETLTLTVHESGAGAPTIVWLHGWMATPAVFEALQARVDLGRSMVLAQRGAAGPAASYAIPDHGRDVLRVLDMAGVDRFALVGHSMGAKTAQWVASEAPERVQALALVNPVPAGALPLPDELATLFRGAGGNRESFATILGMASPELATSDRDALVEAAMGIPAEGIAQSFDAWSLEDHAERLSAIRCPTLIVGSDDAFLPRELLEGAIQAKIAGSELTMIDGAGHYLPLERPDALWQALGAFLRRVTG
ncbi:MAG: alpha/beta hydrolase [Myxococcota bacterium]